MCNIDGPPLKKRKPQPMSSTDPLPIYLDYNATTPLCQEAWHAMTKVNQVWGNPSSTHPFGLAAKFELENARHKMCKSLNAATDDSIIFTSGGTESNNLAIIGGALAVQKAHPQRRFIISTNVEHPAVSEVLKYLQCLRCVSFQCIDVPVNPHTGQLDLERFQRALMELPDGPRSVCLVTIMFANNEIGSINLIQELVQITRRLCGSECLFHTDAAQSLGKVQVDVQDTDVDLLSVCAHKFYGPKGVGALYIKPGVHIRNVVQGAGHERGLRPGTENVLLAAGMAEALAYACTNIETFSTRMRTTRNELLRVLEAELHTHDMGMVINGDLAVALPNTLSCALYKRHTGEGTSPARMFISAQRLLFSVGDKVCMSAGSACHSVSEGENIEISAPLKAVGADLARAVGTLRMSTGRSTTMDEVRRAARVIARHAAQQFSD